ncbi:Bacterial extracellular solute-binding protein [Aquisphaera giovannonii]|uniref:Bacterial extracellular solute-binding protein n=1 Tax=Aquisphaera giovannonii TaxID=406548 RepID=A0A5B9WA10_9BACT|nr:extracellular solute-binding protein [Aquisphaera giovannonii]QEH37277.1 Bacterial extracellular solute-binding protein [Aquisphaera giovannonii]
MLSSRLAWSLALAMMAAGCSEPDTTPAVPPPPSFKGSTLTVGALGDPAILAGLAAHRGEWVATRGGEVVIRQEPIPSVDQVSSVDVLVFPGQELGNLVDAQALEAIPNEQVIPARKKRADEEPSRIEGEPAPAESPAESFKFTDIVPAYRDRVTRYGEDRMALPLGGSALVLVYRKDAFARPENVEAARAAGITLEPPETWTQLDRLAAFFQGRDWAGHGHAAHGLAAVLAADPEGVGDALFLARSASLGQHRNHFSFWFDSDAMKPRVDSPPFEEALAAITAWKSCGPPGCEKFDAASARAAFRDGKVAMLIDRAERAATWSGGSPVGVSRLPGSERVFEPLRNKWETPESPNAPSYLPAGGGWLVGVRRGLSDAQREAALDLARYLASPEISNRLRSEQTFAMLPVRSSQIGQGLPDPASSPDVDPRQWSDAVGRTLMADRVIPGLRIPEAAGYLNDVAEARLAALAGKAPGDALRELSTRWTARTKALGKHRQLWHYRRSLNTLSTASTPPARGQ